MSSRPVDRPPAGSPAEQVETTLFRALIGLRAVVALYAVVLNVVRFEEFARPVSAVVALVVIVLWSVFVSWAYDAPRRRTFPLFAADLAVAVLLVLSTPVLQSQAMLERHASTVPSFWVVAPVLAWAAGRRWWEALLAAVLLSVADVSVRLDTSGATWGNIFLLLLAAVVVGYTASILREAVEMRAAAERVAAAHAERVRLARVVHDGVLQVLALVQRRGTADPSLADLGRLAGEQEVALRALVQSDARTLASTGASDLMDALSRLESSRVSVAGPGGELTLPARQVDELVAVVGSCLDNVRVHVGEDAPAWVLVEVLPDRVLVSVRDEGPGIPNGRLDAAVGEGRLGVSDCIVGRMSDLGGSASLVTAPGQGTEWELSLPR